MRLFQHHGQFVAKTQYGEWAAKEAGFQWDKDLKVWRTTDPTKAENLERATGLSFRMSAPPPTTPGDKWPMVMEGCYALHDPKDGVLKFYQVDKPREGKWAGWTFVKVLASDTRWPIKDKEHKDQILSEIAKDPRGAMALYGQKIGACGHCGRTLTDELSRQIGIGPVCRKHLDQRAA